jgi:hypothetical protein
VERARGLEIAVDAALVEEVAHVAHVLVAEAREPLRLGVAEVRDREGVAVVDALAEHPRVAPARSVGGDALLEDDDLLRRVHRLEHVRRPEARESRADDGDVGLSAALQGRVGLASSRREPIAGLLDGASFI